MAARPLRSAATVLLAAAALVSGCGGDDSSSSASSQTSTLTGVHTQLEPAPGLGVKMAAIAPATSGSGGIVLPITGGQVNLDTLAGTVQQGGGLKFTSGGKSASLTGVVINTSSKQLSGSLGGADVAVMDLSTGPVNQTGGSIQADITLTLSSDGASALNDALGSSLKSGATAATGVIQAKAASG